MTDVEIRVTETYYSLLKSHLSVHICTASYGEFFLIS